MEKLGTIDFNEDITINSYGEDIVELLIDNLSCLQEEYKSNNGNLNPQTLSDISTYQTQLRKLIVDGRSQLSNYMIDSISKIDENSKEEILSLKYTTSLFNNRLNYMSKVLEESNEKMWDLIIYNSGKHWRIK